MKGRSQFTEDEANKIRALLSAKGTVNRADQKKARDKLRKLGFYITDFTDAVDGFGVIDFDQLVKAGRIGIGAD